MQTFLKIYGFKRLLCNTHDLLRLQRHFERFCSEYCKMYECNFIRHET